ncbi:MAG: hypothetical protein MI757_07000, partial [Pirellulales bacterium]|nr:hypothetical protein [Pirellulales bacterium]
MKLKYLDQWARGRFKPMAMLAQTVATSAADCHEVILRSREPWLLTTDEAQSITPANWSTYHRRPLQLEGEMAHFLGAPDDPMGARLAGEIWPELRYRLFDAVREDVKKVLLEGVTREEFDDGNHWWDLYYRWVHMPTLEALVAEEVELEPHYRQWFAEPGLVFFLSVATPCWLEYHRSPWQLLLEARHGSFDSLEKLLRLDPEVAHDPAI